MTNSQEPQESGNRLLDASRILALGALKACGLGRLVKSEKSGCCSPGSEEPSDSMSPDTGKNSD